MGSDYKVYVFPTVLIYIVCILLPSGLGTEQGPEIYADNIVRARLILHCKIKVADVKTLKVDAKSLSLYFSIGFLISGLGSCKNSVTKTVKIPGRGGGCCYLNSLSMV